jgi:hypothetical protein
LGPENNYLGFFTMLPTVSATNDGRIASSSSGNSEGVGLALRGRAHHLAGGRRQAAVNLKQGGRCHRVWTSDDETVKVDAKLWFKKKKRKQ